MTRIRRSRMVLALSVVFGTALVLAASPAAAAPVGLAPIGASVAPPIDCRGTRRPEPVVVLPGGDGTIGQTMEQWRVITEALRRAGACVLVFQYGVVDGRRGAGDVPSSARAVAAFIERVKAETGARRVDIVAHSEGGFIANYYAKVLRGAPNIRVMVLLAPATHGTDGVGVTGIWWPAGPARLLAVVPALKYLVAFLLPNGSPALEMLTGSSTVRAVTDGPIAQPGVRYAVLATRRDMVATPAGTASFILEPGVANVFYEDLFPTGPQVDHSSLRSSPLTAGWVARQLYFRPA
jgi:triacylglycerol esterase/lipase EstA (alpha/beta hydrolase family)